MQTKQLYWLSIIYDIFSDVYDYKKNISKIRDIIDHLTFINLAWTTFLSLFSANYKAKIDNRQILIGV